MVLRIYSEEWHEIVGYLREAAQPISPPWLGQLLIKARLAEVDGRSEFNPDGLGKKVGGFQRARISLVSESVIRTRIFARTQSDPKHYLVFDLGEDPFGEHNAAPLDSVLRAFWIAQKPIRLEWKICCFTGDFWVDSETAKLFQQPPLVSLDLGTRDDDIARWLRTAVSDAAKFIAAQRRVLEEYCAPASGLEPEFLLPAWKRTRLGHMLNLLGVS